MRSFKELFLVIGITLLFQTVVAKSNQHDHHNHGKSDSKLNLNNGKKWSTDKPLRDNMDAIHNHIKSSLDKIHTKKMRNSEYQALSKKVRGNINSIFKNCKLPPKADAQLHILLSSMLSANDKLLEQISLEEKAHAVEKILEGYKAYLKHFDHKGAEKH